MTRLQKENDILRRRLNTESPVQMLPSDDVDDLRQQLTNKS